MSLKHMVLGFLMDGSSYGYELKSGPFKKVFKDFGINDGQLYPLLKKLEQEALICKRVQPQEGLPNRHIYSLTAAGKDEFLQWLASDEGEEISFRYDFFRKDLFFIRCNYIRYLPPKVAETKVRRQMEIVANTVKDLQKARDSMLAKGVDPVRVSILDYGIRIQEVRGEWLSDFISELTSSN